MSEAKSSSRSCGHKCKHTTVGAGGMYTGSIPVIAAVLPWTRLRQLLRLYGNQALSRKVIQKRIAILGQKKKGVFTEPPLPLLLDRGCL